MPRIEPAGPRRPQQAGIVHRAVVARRLGEGPALGPFHLHGGDGDEQGAGEIPLGAEGRLIQSFLGGHRREALRQERGDEGIGVEEVDGAGDARAQPFGGEAGNLTDAGAAPSEGGPGVGLALAEGGNEADARHRDERPAPGVAIGACGHGSVPYGIFRRRTAGSHE